MQPLFMFREFSRYKTMQLSYLFLFPVFCAFHPILASYLPHTCSLSCYPFLLHAVSCSLTILLLSYMLFVIVTSFVLLFILLHASALLISCFAILFHALLLLLFHASLHHCHSVILPCYVVFFVYFEV